HHHAHPARLARPGVARRHHPSYRLTGKTTMANRKPKKGIDPITVEVIRHKLDSIAKEMESTLFRSAFSQIVKEARDASASLFTVNGETLAQAIAIPNHLATLIPMVRKLLDT